MFSASLRGNGLRSGYALLLIVRVCFALFGTGYIHPDEYFQNGEVVAGHIAGLHTTSTWEWNAAFPCRSIVPVYLSTGLPFSLLRLLQQAWFGIRISSSTASLATDLPLSPRLLFAAERLSFLLSSFLLDASVYHLVHDSARLQALLLVASSYVVHTYQLRPFSNSIEAVLLALSLVLLKKLLVTETKSSTAQRGQVYLTLLAVVFVFGIFTRITFAAFFLPVAFEILKWSLRQSRFSLHSLARLLSLPVLVGLTTTLGFVYADSIYFHGSAQLELTPLNFLRYNLLPSNLAEHGIHPRWLHLVVNLPMIATPGLLYYVIRAEFDLFTSRSEEKRRPGVVELMQRTYYWVRWSATSLLSIQPHQEPRFLTPLLVPMIAIAANNARILRGRKPFLAFWIVTNAVLAVLFGVLHQGGVVPSLFRVHDIVYGDTSGVQSHDIRIVFWKTYMPPRHLLAIRQEDVDMGKVSVQDVSGASPESTLHTLLTLAPSSHARPLAALLVAPIHAVRTLDALAPGCVEERERVFPHLDLDHIAESVQVGWRDGLSLGIFDVDIACLRRAAAAA